MATLSGAKLAEPTDARQVRSRKALHAALLELLEEKPFDQLTIREISARAGTGYATFFRHYVTKEALLGDVASEEIAGLLAMTLPILHQADSYHSTLALCSYVAEHSALWSALLAGGAAAIVRNEFIRQARLLPHAGQHQERWLPADLGVVHGTGAMIDLLAWWLTIGTDLSAEQIATILHRLVIAPLVEDSEPRKTAATA
ncbi:AcrR family transcriptional regulator [Novosphingobium chloroacetimidivorans]|uniref:AcrR family transcriptional regulator n=1 Tax=Novosphingobium chloroacetimidivorans TaxID=1428314 RepID=A0A7W7KA49_9SPHN|nr:TetR/AcrR family transcriptional regulator [Novosphingobium chloroacetimidivorans]MBB4858418.1 AcrR family transcriptional regulator [Novosphingobium chloroacetimidivorans]